MSKLSYRVHNGKDIIDSRDIVARVRELEGELEDTYNTAVETWEAERNLQGIGLEDTSVAAQVSEDYNPKPASEFEEWLRVEADNDNDEAAELVMLRALVEEIDQNAGDRAKDGVTLIADSYFEQYAQEVAEDNGAIGHNLQWPANCIDWERAARELQYDYSRIDFDGVDYWVRS